MTSKKVVKKQKVFFVATKYKNKPATVQFYTKTGKQVQSKSVEKKVTKTGVQHFTTI